MPALAHECVDRPHLPCPACVGSEQRAQTRLLDMIRPTTGEKEPFIRLLIYVPCTLQERVMETAKECGVGLSAFCRQALTAYLEEIEAGE